MKYTNEFDKVSYCLGIGIANNLREIGVKKINPDAFMDAVQAIFAGNIPAIMPDEAENILQDFFEKLKNEEGEAAKTAGAKFLAENKGKEGVVALPSGLQYMPLRRTPHQRHSLRFIHPPRRTGRISCKRRHPGMGGSLATHACRLQMATLHPVRTGLRFTRSRTCHRSQRDPHFRRRTFGYRLMLSSIVN